MHARSPLYIGRKITLRVQHVAALLYTLVNPAHITVNLRRRLICNISIFRFAYPTADSWPIQPDLGMEFLGEFADSMEMLELHFGFSRRYVIDAWSSSASAVQISKQLRISTSE